MPFECPARSLHPRSAPSPRGSSLRCCRSEWEAPPNNEWSRRALTLERARLIRDVGRTDVTENINHSDDEEHAFGSFADRDGLDRMRVCIARIGTLGRRRAVGFLSSGGG